MEYRVNTLSNHPDGLQALKALNAKSWPLFLCHGEMPSWERIYDAFADFLLLIVDADGSLAGAGFTIPVSWSGRSEDLPATIEDIIVNGLQASPHSANHLMAVAALVDNRYRGQKLSAEILKQMKQLAQRHGLLSVTVPVRPTWKARYPLQSMESYAGWKRADGLCYDPWLRTHQRLGARMIKCVASTLDVTGSIEQWQQWTGMIFPQSGSYIVDGALQPVDIDVDADIGIYHDPNVWMLHDIS